MKGYEKIKELIEEELNDYSYFKMGELKINNCYELSEDDEYYEIDIEMGFENKKKTLYFHYDRKEDKIEIEISEDNFEEVTSYDWRIKYFWMTLLKWE